MTHPPLRLTRPSLSAAMAILTGILLSSCSDDNDPVPAQTPFSHAEHFADNPYVGPNMNTACVGCHAKEVQDLMHTGHWNWAGTAANIVGVETESHGKKDVINNFCIALPTNEGRCTQCHIGTGWTDANFNFSDPANVDCLCCHDTTGTYAKATTTAGMPVSGLDWAAIGAAIGMPGRANCGACHYGAGGGDNVKHGDLAANLNNTTREYDVHMGTDGGDMDCTACHGADDVHGIGGMPFHSVTEGNMRGCEDCHTATPHENGTAAMPDSAMNAVSAHENLSCQACHIPAIARFRTTKTEWYWSEAGDQVRVPVDVGDGRFDYDKMKGEFVWESNVRPVLRRHDGTWNKVLIGVNDTYTGTPSPTEPVVLGEPAAPKDITLAAGAKIYPFKKMVADQVADTVNQRIMVPHLWGTKGGAHPYWAQYDWNNALQDAATRLGISYSGTYGFVDTVQYLAVNHEIAPKEQALGHSCIDCHGGDRIDWTELGRSVDPFNAVAPN